MTNGYYVPKGYEATVGGDVDRTELTELVVRAEHAIDGSARATESFVTMLIDAPQTDRDEGTISLRESRTGDLVGFGMLQNAEPHVESVRSGWVDPDHVGHGLGAAIVAWGLGRARSQIHLAPDGARVTTRCQAGDADIAAAELFEAFEYQADRHDIEMELVFDGPVSVAPLPPGITVRTMSGAQDLLIVGEVTAEAFRDHYGWVDSSHEQRTKRWENFRGMDEWDDDLVFIAQSGDTAVGVALGLRSYGTATDAGYIGSLGVVRSWRGKGLARALLTMAFDRYQRNGMRSVALHVDADSLTGATRLYHSVGMKPVRTETAFLLELRPGMDLVKR